MKAIQDADFDREVTQQDGVVIVDVSATWCAPCKTLEPVLKSLEKDNEHLVIVKVDVDKNAASVTRLNVQNVPCLVFFKSGQEVSRLTGLRSKSDLQNTIDTL